MRYLLSRLAQGVLTLFGVSLLTFFLPKFFQAPTGLAVQVLGQRATPHAILGFLHEYGLDRSLPVQYWHWLVAALHGNFGISYQATATQGTPVTVNQLIGSNVWRSIWLTFVPTILSVLIAIPIGLTQAVRRNRPYDHVMTTVVYVVYSTPAVLVCLLLVYYFAIQIHVGTVSIDALAVQISPSAFPMWALHHLRQFILPFVGIIALSVGGLTRFMRGSALDTLVQDHVRTARAKGASPTRVLFKHVLRPSLIPMLTIIGLSIPSIIGGALSVESVFNYPGMGLLAVRATTVGDFTVVMALTIYTAGLTVIGNYLADIFTAIADPRVRLGKGRN